MSETDAILAQLKPEDIESVYDGGANRCACGCSGTYWGPEYPEHPAATNERMVALILARTQRRARKAADGEVEPLGTHQFSNGQRCWYYQTKTRLIRIETKEATR